MPRLAYSGGSRVAIRRKLPALDRPEWHQCEARETITAEGFNALAWGIQSTQRLGA